jgi:hypothetical protein
MAVAKGGCPFGQFALFFVETGTACDRAYVESMGGSGNLSPLGKLNMALDFELLRGERLAWLRVYLVIRCFSILPKSIIWKFDPNNKKIANSILMGNEFRQRNLRFKSFRSNTTKRWAVLQPTSIKLVQKIIEHLGRKRYWRYFESK